MLSLEGGAAALMHSLGAPTADAELPPGALHDPSVTLLPALAQCNPARPHHAFSSRLQRSRLIFLQLLLLEQALES